MGFVYIWMAHSMTIMISAWVCRTSCSRMTFGWLSSLSSRISLARRPDCVAITMRLRLRHLIANSLPSGTLCASLTLPNVPLPRVLPIRYSCVLPAFGAGRLPMRSRQRSSDVACEGTALPSAMKRSSMLWSGAMMHTRVACDREPRNCSSSDPSGAVASVVGRSASTSSRLITPL